MCSHKKSCSACERGISAPKKKKMAKKAKKMKSVDVGNLVKQSGAAALGFGLSNVVTAQVANIAPSLTANRTVPGLIKIAAGALTIAFAGRGKSDSAQLIQSAASGMAVSGVLDLGKQFLPATIQTAIGINAPATLLRGGRSIRKIGGNQRVMQNATIGKFRNQNRRVA